MNSIKFYLFTFTVCLGAVAAGTVLAWTAPVLPQLRLNDSSIEITDSEGN